jgi:hypothetical protein
MRLVRDHGLVNHLGHGLGGISGSEKRLNVAAQLDLLKKEPLVEINALARKCISDSLVTLIPSSMP